MFWSILQKPLDPLKFECNFGVWEEISLGKMHILILSKKKGKKKKTEKKKEKTEITSWDREQNMVKILMGCCSLCGI